MSLARQAERPAWLARGSRAGKGSVLTARASASPGSCWHQGLGSGPGAAGVGVGAGSELASVRPVPCRASVSSLADRGPNVSVTRVETSQASAAGGRTVGTSPGLLEAPGGRSLRGWGARAVCHGAGGGERRGQKRNELLLSETCCGVRSGFKLWLRQLAASGLQYVTIPCPRPCPRPAGMRLA